jgi:hypothetical protein
MWEYYLNNIHLLFLPPHNSHVLQPLDLSVFAPLKQAYRKQFGNLNLLIDSTLVGKRNFLIYYQKTRTSSLTKDDIKARRRQASGLWPTNIAKPLINRLLLENSNKAIELSLGTSGNVLALKWNQDGSYIICATPQKSKDIRHHIQVITRSRGLDLPIC